MLGCFAGAIYKLHVFFFMVGGAGGRYIEVSELWVSMKFSRGGWLVIGERGGGKANHGVKR
jgi:hypothetical protein